MIGEALSCSQPATYEPAFGASNKKKELIYGLPSLSLNETHQLLVRYLNKHLDSVQVRLVACVSGDDYEDQVRKGNFDFTIINGLQLILAEQSGYHVTGCMADEYRSVIFVNKDSGINSLPNLKGHTISLTGRKILAGAVMPLMYLKQHGLDVERDINRRYAPSYESVLMDVCLGKSSAGAVLGIAFRNFSRLKPELASHLEVRWVTPPLPGSALLMKRSLDKDLTRKLAGLFFHMQDDSAGRQALAQIGITKFQPADSSDYAPMKLFIREFDSQIHLP